MVFQLINYFEPKSYCTLYRTDSIAMILLYSICYLCNEYCNAFQCEFCVLQSVPIIMTDIRRYYVTEYQSLVYKFNNFTINIINVAYTMFRTQLLNKPPQFWQIPSFQLIYARPVSPSLSSLQWFFTIAATQQWIRRIIIIWNHKLKRVNSIYDNKKNTTVTRPIVKLCVRSFLLQNELC